jgi:hypothetical protein
MIFLGALAFFLLLALGLTLFDKLMLRLELHAAVRKILGRQ